MKRKAIFEWSGMIWRKSRNRIVCFGPALVLALAACAVAYAQEVRTNYMPGTDFSKYRTYAWGEEIQGVPAVGGHPDQILDAQVKQAIDSQMATKGLTKADSVNLDWHKTVSCLNPECGKTHEYRIRDLIVYLSFAKTLYV